LGEAIIANYGGNWIHHEQGLAIEFEDGSIGFPFAKTDKQFENGLEDNIYGLYRYVQSVRSPDRSVMAITPKNFRRNAARSWWKFW
jgi:hypothetical protein